MGSAWCEQIMVHNSYYVHIHTSRAFNHTAVAIVVQVEAMDKPTASTQAAYDHSCVKTTKGPI